MCLNRPLKSRYLSSKKRVHEAFSKNDSIDELNPKLNVICVFGLPRYLNFYYQWWPRGV